MSGKFTINAAWGSFGSDGRWYPNLSLPLTMQRQQNIEAGHLCPRCEYHKSRCVCWVEPPCASSSNPR